MISSCLEALRILSISLKFGPRHWERGVLATGPPGRSRVLFCFAGLYILPLFLGLPSPCMSSPSPYKTMLFFLFAPTSFSARFMFQMAPLKCAYAFKWSLLLEITPTLNPVVPAKGSVRILSRTFRLRVDSTFLVTAPNHSQILSLASVFHLAHSFSQLAFGGDTVCWDW